MHGAEGDALAPHREESCWQPLEQGLQHPVLLAQLPSAAPLQIHGLHGAQMSLSPSQGSCPRSPGHGHSLPGAQVTREEHEHSQNTQSRQSVCPPTSPFSPPALCALTVAFRDTLVCLPRAAAPPQNSPGKNLVRLVSLSIPHSFRIQGRAVGCDQVNSSDLHSSLSFA